jgi:cytoskeletal protein CcmA (bactofilin family)
MAKEIFNSGSSHNTIASGTNIQGHVVAETDLRLDGEIAGNISCSGKIIIGEKASVKGDIIAESAEIMGIVHGNIQVKEILTIKSTAQIHGNVQMHTLSVEPNAILTGFCSMI